MKSEFFIDALEFLDDSLLLEADKKRVDRKKMIYIRTLSAAACIVLVLGAMFLLGSPYKSEYKLLVGKDWRFLREEDLVLTTERPEYVCEATEVPPTSKPTTPESTKRPVSATQVPDMVTEEPKQNSGSKDSVILLTPIPEATDIYVPEVTDIPVPEETDIPASDESEDEGWTEYLAKNETESGELYGVEQRFVMQLFAAALDVEYVEPTETPLPEPTTMPTLVPTTNPFYTPEPTLEPAPMDPEPTYEPVITSEPTSEPIAPEDTYQPETSDGWDYSVQISGVNYNWQKREISYLYIENYLGNYNMTGKTKSGTTKFTNVSTYNIKGVSTKAAVTVKPNSLDGYYLFANTKYTPDSFKTFVSDYNLKEYLKWDTLAVYGKNTVNTNISSSAMWNILANTDGKRVDAKNVYLNCTLTAAVAMDIDIYGYEDIPMAVYKEGYVVFSLFNQVHAFYIGEADVNRIVNY